MDEETLGILNANANGNTAMTDARNGLTLDIDEPNTFAPEFCSVLNTDDFQCSLDERAIGSHELLEKLIDDVSQSNAHHFSWMSSARTAVEQLIRSKYASVAAYHGCRPLDRADYQNRGLLRTNKALLKELARKVFSDVFRTDVFNRVCTGYLQRYDGQLGLFLSAYDDQLQRMRAGNFLGKMARELGAQGQECLNSFIAATAPMIIKCTVPLGWLDDAVGGSCVHLYVTAVLQRMICARIESDSTGMSFGGFRIKHDISSDMLLDFIDAAPKRREI